MPSGSPPAVSPPATSPRRPSIPMDASKLNNNPAPLPPQADPIPRDDPSPPPTAGGDSSSAYLEGNPETPQHPTVAETGPMPTSPGHGAGPSSGQLQRRESDVGRRIIRLSSFGGEGLVAKPPVGLDGAEMEGSAIE